MAYTDVAFGFELQVIAACVIGGVSIAGGVGTVAGVVLGCLFLGLVRNALPHGRHLAVLADGDQRRRHHGSRRHERTHRRQRAATHSGKGDDVSSAANASRQAGASRSVLRKMLRWELFLALVLAADFIVNALLSPYFLDPVTLSDATFNFTEKAIVALPMALLILIREIDISVAGHNCTGLRYDGSGCSCRAPGCR